MTDLEGAVELDEAHRALTAASRQLPQLWEQPNKAAEGVVVKPQHLRLILAALKAARHDYHTKTREADDALASITRERDAMREAGKPFFDLAKTVTTPAPGSPPWWQESQDWTVVFSFAGCAVTLGDLRRAAALVNGEVGE